jgi:hypothetical protein
VWTELDADGVCTELDADGVWTELDADGVLETWTELELLE